MAKAPAARAGARGARERPPLDPAASGAGAAEPAWLARAAWVGIAAFGVATAVFAFVYHPLGDYFTESDFYEYVAGGRAMTRGHVDPGRYGIYGPVYEAMLAPLTLLPFESFRLAVLLSIGCACATLACWFEILRRRAGSAVALWALVFLAANPVFFRYAYSATNDVPAMALQSGSLFALLASRRAGAPAWAGVLAALATLTRYTNAYLILVAAGVFLWRRQDGAPTAPRSLAAFALGLGIVLVPWTAYSVSSGHVPGARLVSNYRFYTTESGSARNIQDAPDPARAREEAQGPVGVGPKIARWVRSVPAHLRLDLATMLEWPVAALCGAGALLAAVRRRTWDLGAVWLQGALQLIVLAGAFYSDRYSMAIAPAYLSLAGVAIVHADARARLRVGAIPLAALVALVPLALSIRSNVLLQRFVRRQLPFEVLEAARTLRAIAPEDAAVLSRKGHIGHYARRRGVTIPRLAGLAELAEHARRARAEWLYFSWYEGELRPEFWFLLDTTAAVPGLTPVFRTTHNPAILYRIDARFGEPPAWQADSALRKTHELRGYVQVVHDAEAHPLHRALGLEAAARGEDAVALDHFVAMTRGRPRDPEAWVLAGRQSARLERFEQAREAFGHAEALEPTSLTARVGRGMAELALGRMDEAERTLRPAAGRIGSEALEALIVTYRLEGAVAGRARTILGPGPPTPAGRTPVR